MISWHVCDVVLFLLYADIVQEIQIYNTTDDLSFEPSICLRVAEGLIKSRNQRVTQRPPGTFDVRSGDELPR